MNFSYLYNSILEAHTINSEVNFESLDNCHYKSDIENKTSIIFDVINYESFIYKDNFNITNPENIFFEDVVQNNTKNSSLNYLDDNILVFSQVNEFTDHFKQIKKHKHKQKIDEIKQKFNNKSAFKNDYVKLNTNYAEYFDISIESEFENYLLCKSKYKKLIIYEGNLYFKNRPSTVSNKNLKIEGVCFFGIPDVLEYFYKSIYDFKEKVRFKSFYFYRYFKLLSKRKAGKK